MRVFETAQTNAAFHPAATADIDELRKRIGRGIAAIGRAPDARGSGNASKRIRIWASGVGGFDELESVVSPG